MMELNGIDGVTRVSKGTRGGIFIREMEFRTCDRRSSRRITINYAPNHPPVRYLINRVNVESSSAFLLCFELD